jgi:uncharacterized protein (TIGR02611 family)
MMTPSTATPRPTPERVRWWRRLARVAVTHWRRVPRPARQLCVAVLGMGVLLAGVALIVLPGPAVLVIPLGLAILATEFPWARKLLDRGKAHVLRFKHIGAALARARGKRSPTSG